MKNQNEKKMELFIIYINIYNLNHLPLDKGFTFHSAELWDSVSSKPEGNTQIRYRLGAIYKSGQYTNQDGIIVITAVTVNNHR